MSPEHIDYLNDRMPIGVTKEMVYQAVIKYIYQNILEFNNDVETMIEINKKVSIATRLGPYEFAGPLTMGEAANYFIQQYMGDV